MLERVSFAQDDAGDCIARARALRPLIIAHAARIEQEREIVPEVLSALHDAQLVVARSYGFESWPKLKAYVDGVTVKRLADSGRGLGLLGLRERIELLGGTATVDSSPGDGTRVTLTVPVAAT